MLPPPDEPNRLLPQFVAACAQFPLEPVPGAERVVGDAQPLVDRQHQGDGGLRHGHGVDAGRYADGHPAPGSGLQIDLVHPDPVLLDQLELRARLDHPARDRRPRAEEVICVPGLRRPLLLSRGLGENQIQALRLLANHQLAHGGRENVHAQHDRLLRHVILLNPRGGNRNPLIGSPSRSSGSRRWRVRRR